MKMLQSLGSGRSFLHSFLSHIAAKQFSWLQNDATLSPDAKRIDEGNRVEMAATVLFFFLAIAPSLPADRQTNKLVQKAVTSLHQERQQVSRWISQYNLKYYDGMTQKCLSHWQNLSQLSSQERWETYQSMVASFAKRHQAKGTRKNLKKCYRSETGHEQCCANCFETEQDLNDKGKKLSRCSRCGLTLYCSRECQVEHWKKEHKASCQPRAATKKT